MTTESKALRLAHGLVDDFFAMQTGIDTGKNLEIAQASAMICVKEMKKQFKLGFNLPGSDHSYKDSSEWEILVSLPKFIRKYRLD